MNGKDPHFYELFHNLNFILVVSIKPLNRSIRLLMTCDYQLQQIT